MMPEKFNAALIDLICKNAPEEGNPAMLIADMLNIGREAAYRRLRGEVLFSFGEAAILASRLNFSLDRSMGVIGAGNVLFQMQFNDFYSTLEKYSEMLERDIRFFRKIASEPDTVYAMAGGLMPAELYMRYEHVAKFKFFKWLYQHGLSDPKIRTFEQLQVPQTLVDNYGEYVRCVEGVKNTWYVFDNNGFKHWVTAIRAFRAMHLISQESVCELRKELLQLLDQMEKITVNGGHKNGNKVVYYLSDVDLESTYSYLSTPQYKASSIGVFSLNSLRTTDPMMFDQVKRWVQTQMRFSTLITGSGELQRVRYFKRQRELVCELEREGDMPSPEACLE